MFQIIHNILLNFTVFLNIPCTLKVNLSFVEVLMYASVHLDNKLIIKLLETKLLSALL